MLKKSHRLNLKEDFKWVASGKKLETQNLKLFIKNGENEQPRIGVAISSKNFKKATDRNRAKRLVFQAFQSILHKLPPTINIIALPKKGVLSVKSSELEKELEIINDKIAD